jgi:hypothetical protein
LLETRDWVSCHNILESVVQNIFDGAPSSNNDINHYVISKLLDPIPNPTGTKFVIPEGSLNIQGLFFRKVAYLNYGMLSKILWPVDPLLGNCYGNKQENNYSATTEGYRNNGKQCSVRGSCNSSVMQH